MLHYKTNKNKLDALKDQIKFRWLEFGWEDCHRDSWSKGGRNYARVPTWAVKVAYENNEVLLEIEDRYLCTVDGKKEDKVQRHTLAKRKWNKHYEGAWRFNLDE